MKPQKAFTYIGNDKIDRDVKTLFDYVSRLELVVTDPNGSRTGRFSGEAVYLQTGGKHYLSVYIISSFLAIGNIIRPVPKHFAR